MEEEAVARTFPAPGERLRAGPQPEIIMPMSNDKHHLSPCHQPGSPFLWSPRSSLQVHPPPGSAVLALRSKIRGLSQRRTAGRNRDVPVAPVTGFDQAQASKGGQDLQASPSPAGSPVTVKRSSSSDEEAEPRFQKETDVIDQLRSKDAGEWAASTCGTSPFSHGLVDGANRKSLQDRVTEPQEESIAVNSPPLRGGALLPRDGSSSGPEGRMSSQMCVGPMEVQTEPEELERSDSLESHPRCCSQKMTGLVVPLGGLWRADSGDSVCSSGSPLSLAERVEVNRGILRQMLHRADRKDADEMSGLRPERPREEMSEGKCRGSAGLNDSDWDSGISLQESEHTHRSFVSAAEDLPLSPRHQQAKRLLERARMKARSHPLKADHTILPVQRSNLELGGVSPRRAPLSGKEGWVVSPGDLSDSSSSDSACGRRRRRSHGQSPSRVRFEDESEKDAEVRYLERLGQRPRAGGRAQGLLVSKPRLSAYVHGAREEDTRQTANHGRICEDDPLFNHKACMALKEGLVNNGGLCESQETGGVKCNSCGFVLEGGPTSHPNSGSQAQAQSRQTAPDDQAVIPRWVAPTRPNSKFQTERIRETYIGEITSTGEMMPGKTADNTGNGSVKGTGEVTQKLKSRKGDGRSNPGRGPHVQPLGGSNGHDLKALREILNSKLRPNGTETALPPNPYLVEQFGQSHHSASFTADHAQVSSPTEVSSHQHHEGSPTTTHPARSALKAARTRAGGQKGVQLLPSLQYGLTQPEVDGRPGEPDAGHLRGDTRTAREHPGPPGALHMSLQDPDRVLGHGEGGPSPVHLCPPGPSASNRQVPCVRPSTLMFTPARVPTDHAVTQRHMVVSGAAGSGQDQQVKGDWYHDVVVCAGPALDPRPGPDHMDPPRAEPPGKGNTDAAEGLDPQKRVLVEGREGKPKLSLCRLFSAIGLSGAGKLGRGRSSSLEQLSFSPKAGSPSLSPAHKQYGQLKKTPSLQSLRVGSPFAQLRKASSVQSLQPPRRKDARSTAYTPGDQPSNPALSCGLQRALSVDDVGCPSGVRSVGRVAQVFPDGTLLLELSRPSHGPFGFLISRGIGRPDSGVYVEDMGDSGTGKLYTGLLGVGDEILEVNGEKVAGLSLDQVTWLMTRDDTASIRVLRNRLAPR